MRTLYEGGPAVLNLGKGYRIKRIVLSTNHLQMVGQPLEGMFDKTLIVVARHTNINVIIPRYEPLMTHGSKHGAVHEIIAKTVLTTHTVDIGQYIE